MRNFDENFPDLCYVVVTMKEEAKPLSQTNPYLKNKAQRQQGLIVSVCSSSAVEGIAAKRVVAEYLQRKGEPQATSRTFPETAE